MKLIIGLGNPGQAYRHNRHNIGFMCLGHLARKHGIKLDKKQCQARTGTGNINNIKVLLARPQTYMNLSGQSVSQLVRKFEARPDDLLVIHDDLDLPPGKIRIRQNSGSGGHKGINSIINCLDSQDFIRIRVGIGHPEAAEPAKETEVISYVLSSFTPEERRIINNVIPKVSEAIIYLLTEGIVATMNRYN